MYKFFFLFLLSVCNTMPVNISANFLEINPILDGNISINEYSYASPYFVNFSESGFYWNGGIKRLNTTNDDHSGFMYFGYTNTTLNIAFNMSDNFIDYYDVINCFQNDGVEIFINGDLVNNDFGNSGNREGFQLVVDAVGNKMTNVANQLNFNNTMWNVSTQITSWGYIIEVEIPLYLIDTLDGPGEKAPTINSTIKINIAFNDNDRNISAQDAQGALWLNPLRESPYTVKEIGWPVELFFLDRVLTTTTTQATTTTTPTTTTPTTTQATTTTTTQATTTTTTQATTTTTTPTTTITTTTPTTTITTTTPTTTPTPTTTQATTTPTTTTQATTTPTPTTTQATTTTPTIATQATTITITTLATQTTNSTNMTNTALSESKSTSNKVYIYAPISSIIAVFIILITIYVYKNKKINKVKQVNKTDENINNTEYDINTLTNDNKIYATPILSIYDFYNTSVEQNTNNAYDIANCNNNQNISYEMAKNGSNDNNELYGFIGNINSYLDIETK